MYKLLIVDDEIEMRNGLKRYISWKEMGFQDVYYAENGKDALRYIRENPVDCILCDVNMPIMNGLDLARIIFEMGLDIKIIFLSGYSEFEYAREAIRYKVEDYLLKPIRLHEIKNTFLRLCKQLDEKAKERKEDLPGNEEFLRKKVCTYVRENYKDASLKKAAEMVHMSPAYFSSYFKRINGIGFSDYLFQVKMEQAAVLLSNPDNKIYEVSEMLGYHNPKNFTKAFKLYHGVVPREFRK